VRTIRAVGSGEANFSAAVAERVLAYFTSPSPLCHPRSSRRSPTANARSYTSLPRATPRPWATMSRTSSSSCRSLTAPTQSSAPGRRDWDRRNLPLIII
jgi:hypothetical protein